MQLTSTNRPFGLSIEFTLRSEICHDLVFRSKESTLVCKPCSYIYRVQQTCSTPIYAVVKDRRLGALRQFAGEFTARVPPVPIPNTEVKPRRADGTARASVWEIRSSPAINLNEKGPQARLRAFSCRMGILSISRKPPFPGKSQEAATRG